MSGAASNGPGVSVLMAVRDGAGHLAETVASLAAQRDPGGGIEFVVVDDASTDATPRLLAEWAARDDRVRIVAVEAPMGLARALNLGLEAVRAPLVARADADDLYAPDRLARQAAAFRAAPRLDALSTGYMRIDEAGDELGAVVPVTGPEIIRFRMLWTNSLLHPGVMARTQALRAAGGYDPGLLDGAGQRPLGADGGGGGPARQPAPRRWCATGCMATRSWAGAAPPAARSA